ncbi:MAG: hypothetical protein ACRC9L_03870 [Brevinema sp.]
MPKVVVIANSSVESLLAAKLMEKANIAYKAVHFDIGLTNDKPVIAGQRISKYGGMEHFIKNRVEIEKYDVARDFYAEVLSHGGYESGPCLEHSVFVLKRAKEYMQEHGMDFIVTGDVLNQCPITQSKDALQSIDYEAGVEGLVFRPLSAKLLPKTQLEENFRVDQSIFLDYQGGDTDDFAALKQEFDLFGLPPQGGHAHSLDLACHEQDMGRKAFEIFEKGYMLNPTHLNRLGLHLVLKEDSNVVLGRTPFESTYLNLFFQKMKPHNATAFSFQDPRYTFGFIYGKDVTKEDIDFAAKIFVSNAEPAGKSKEISFFDSSYAFFGTKMITSIKFEMYADYIAQERTNEMTCPIFTKSSILVH